MPRRSRDLAYVRTPAGHEVDFLSTDFDGNERLIQVVSETASTSALEREIRALIEAREDHPRAEAVLLVEAAPPEVPLVPEGIRVTPVWQWLLTPEE